MTVDKEIEMALQRGEIDEVLRLMPADEDSHLPLKMSLTPAMLQLAFNLGVIDENHVSVQSLLRLLLTAFRIPRVLPSEVYDPLRNFDATTYQAFGKSAVYMKRGAWTSGAATSMTAADAIASMNSGSFHPRVLRAQLPAVDLAMGSKSLTSLLNFIMAANVRSKSVYSPGPNKTVVLSFTSSDGLMLKKGLAYSEAEELTYGFGSGPIDAAAARVILALDNDGIRKLQIDNPLVSEADEMLIKTMCNSVVGHVGYSGSCLGGDADTILLGLARFLPITACAECMLKSHNNGEDMTAAESRCDSYCPACASEWEKGISEGTCPKHRGLGHWTTRICSLCIASESTCCHVNVVKHTMDACAAQCSALRKRDHYLGRLEAASSFHVTSEDSNDDGDDGSEDGAAIDSDSESREEGLSMVSHESRISGDTSGNTSGGIETGGGGSEEMGGGGGGGIESVSGWRFTHSGILLGSDGYHDGKNERNASKGHLLRVEGWLVGLRLLEVCIADVDRNRRDALTTPPAVLPLRVVRCRCKFSVEDARAQSAVEVQTKLLSDADRDAGVSLVVVTVAPEIYRFNGVNSPSMLRAPYGLVFIPSCGRLIYVDKILGELRQVRMMNLPSENTRVASDLRNPTDLAVIGDKAFVCCGSASESTGLGAGTIAIVDISAVTRPRKKSSRAPTTTLDVMPSASSTGCCVMQPFAIASSPSGIELFVTDVAQNITICLELVGESSVATKIADFVKPPTGIACRSFLGGFSLLVAEGDKVWELSRPNNNPGGTGAWGKQLLWQQEDALLCGVAVSPRGAIAVVDKTGGKIYSLKPSAAGESLVWVGEVVAGSGGDAPHRARDGRATMVPFVLPTMVCFNDKVMVFSESGACAIRMVTDVYTHVAKLMPQMQSVYNVYDGDGPVAPNLVGAHASSRKHADFLDKCAADNAAFAGRGGDGEFGNSSKPVRDVTRIRERNFARLLENLQRLQVPAWVILSIKLKGDTSMHNETFFTQVHRYSPVLNLLEYAYTRSSAELENIKARNGGCGFSHFFGPLDGRGYCPDGAGAAPVIYTLKKKVYKKNKETVASREQKTKDRKTHHALCEMIRGVRQLKPTDRGRSTQGAHPDSFWVSDFSEPGSVDEQRERASSSRSADTATMAEGGSEGTCDIVHRSGDIVLVRQGDGERYVIAQLKSSVKRVTLPPPGGRRRGLPSVKLDPGLPPMKFFFGEDDDDQGSSDEGDNGGGGGGDIEGGCSNFVQGGVLLTADGSWKRSVRASDICSRIQERETFSRTYDPSSKALTSFRITRAESDRILDIQSYDPVEDLEDGSVPSTISSFGRKTTFSLWQQEQQQQTAKTQAAKCQKNSAADEASSSSSSSSF